MSSLACSRTRRGNGDAECGRGRALSLDPELERADSTLSSGAGDRALLAVMVATVFDMPDGWKTRGWPKWKRYDDRKREYREQIRECNRNYPRARGKKEREALLQEAASCSN